MDPDLTDDKSFTSVSDYQGYQIFRVLSLQKLGPQELLLYLSYCVIFFLFGMSIIMLYSKCKRKDSEKIKFIKLQEKLKSMSQAY